MKIIALLALVVLTTAETDYYKLPVLDIVALSADPARVGAHVNCLIDKGPCTDVMEQYKKITREGIEQGCRKCSPFTKYTGALFFPAVKIFFPAKYAELKQKYDPENKYFDTFEQELAKNVNYVVNTLENLNPFPIKLK